MLPDTWLLSVRNGHQGCKQVLLRSTTPGALGLEPSQFGNFFFAAAAQAGFLQLQIADLFFVGNEGVGVDQVRACGEVLFVEQLGEFDAAFGEQSRFESGDTTQTPVGVGDGLYEIRFEEAHGREFFGVGGQMVLVFGDVIGGQQNGAAGEPGLGRRSTTIWLSRPGTWGRR